MGGVYLDTDVIINKSFDDLLDNDSFIGFASNYALCTAVIGAKKGNTYIKGILDMYDNNAFITKESVMNKNKNPIKSSDGKWVPNNEIWGWYTIDRYHNFTLNNKLQKFEDVTIYPKQLFEQGSLLGTYYCRHINYNSWQDKSVKNRPIKRVKQYIERNTFCWIIIRRIVSLKNQKNNNFYKYYMSQRRI